MCDGRELPGGSGNQKRRRPFRTPPFFRSLRPKLCFLRGRGVGLLRRRRILDDNRLVLPACQSAAQHSGDEGLDVQAHALGDALGDLGGSGDDVFQELGAVVPEPYMVILSTLDRGSATFRAISGRACMTISITAASPYFFMASAFLSMPSASARALARMDSASALPTAAMPSASCSLANFWASALLRSASASCSCS